MAMTRVRRWRRPVIVLALGGVMIVGGGVLALGAASTAAGAATAKTSPVPVVEQNLNAAGRIRVQGATGQAQMWNEWGWVVGAQGGNPGGVLAVNVSGSGVFKGLVLSAYQDGNGSCAAAQVYIDGVQVLGDSIGGAYNFGDTNPIEGGQQWGQNGAPSWEMYFTPPGGLPYHSSLQVWFDTDYCGESPLPIASRVWWTQYTSQHTGS